MRPSIDTAHHENQKTIVAVATPPGEGGIGIVRLSGPEALPIGKHLFTFSHAPEKITPHRMYFGYIQSPDNDSIDQGLFVFMENPHSYTGEDVVELHCHGGPLLLQTVVSQAIFHGATTAGRGEFTRRAFMNGKLDLAQAEAVVDLISSVTPESLRISASQLRGGLSRKIIEIKNQLASLLAEVEASIDFPEEELENIPYPRLVQEIVGVRESVEKLLATYGEGRIYREGARVVIVGRPNVGKSSLMNLILEHDRAIVTSEPGTTRDVIEDFANIGGIPIKLIDTCGIAETSSRAEQEGVRRAIAAAQDADLVLLVIDVTGKIGEEERKIIEELKGRTVVVVFNKIDLLPDGMHSFTSPPLPFPDVHTSALLAVGIDSLKDKIKESVLKQNKQGEDEIILNNARHYEALLRARNSLDEVIKSGTTSASPELLAVDIRGALSHLGEITGEVTPGDVLDIIFSRFCIGK
jgi:tRNA modification GTPase